MDANTLARFICAQGIDLWYSRFARAETGELISFGYINRTGNISRLAAMGTVPRGRRSGAGAFLLSHLLNEAKQRDDKTMMLECFEQNAPALALYRRFQFKEVGRLFGWRGKADGVVSHSHKPAQIPLISGSQMSAPADYPDIPWQISRFASVKVPAGRAFKVGQACVVVGATDTTPVRIHGFFGYSTNDWNALRNALAAVLATFPDIEFFAPQLFPEQFGTHIFEPLGFSRESLNQFLMRKDL